MYNLTIAHNGINKISVTITYQEYNIIMKYLLKSIQGDLQTEVSEANKLAQTSTNNDSVSSKHVSKT